MAISLAQFREKQVPILLKSEKDRHAIVLDNGYQTQNLHLAPELANAIKTMRTTCEHDGAITDLDRLVGKIEQYIGQNTIDLGVYTQISERLKELHDYFYNHGAIFQTMTPHINVLIDKIEHFYEDGIEAAPNSQDIFKTGLDAKPEIQLAKEMLAKAGIKESEELAEASVITPTKYSKPFYDKDAKKWIMRKTHVQAQGVKQKVDEAELDAKFDVIEEMVEFLTKKYDVAADVIWEDFESVDDVELYEAAVDAKGYKSSTGGLTQKGRDHFNSQGSNLKAPVTTPPSKLNPDSKAAKRRKSFCARMGGNPGPMKDEHGKPTRKALALKKWNCHESEGSPEGMPHLNKELLAHIIKQIGKEGAEAIVKSLQWGDGAAKELLTLITSDLKKNVSIEESVKQRIDPKCWTGKHKEGTKIKGGVRVNNCVPDVKEELDEAASPTAGTRLVKKYGEDAHRAEVRYNPDYQEYQVHHYKDGKHMGEGPVSYHGDDKEDAHDTAKAAIARRSEVKEDLDEAIHKSDVPAFLRKAKGEAPLTNKEVKDQGKENISHKEKLEKLRNEGIELDSELNAVLEAACDPMKDVEVNKAIIKRHMKLRHLGEKEAEGAGVYKEVDKKKVFSKEKQGTPEKADEIKESFSFINFLGESNDKYKEIEKLRNPNVSDKDLASAHGHADEDIRYAAMRHPKTTKSQLEAGLKDSSKTVRAMASKKYYKED